MSRRRLLIIILVIFFLLPKSVSAFTITPVSFKLTMDPGETAFVKLKIKNDEAREAVFKLKVLGSKQDARGHALFGQGFDEAEKWTKPQTDSFTLRAGAEREVVFAVSVPKGEPAGGHYLGVGAEKISRRTGAVNLSGQLLAALSLQVAGVATENLQITEWRAARKVFLGKKWKFNLALFNRSNIEVPLSGEAAVKGRPAFAKAMAGEDFFSVPLNLGPANFLAGASRLAEPELNLSSSNLIWPGRYAVEAQVHYGRTNQIALAQTIVWYVPWWTIISVFLIMGLVAGWGRKRKKKKYYSPAGGTEY